MALVSPPLNEIVLSPAPFTWKDSLYSLTADKKGTLTSQYNIEEATRDNILSLYQQIIIPLYNAFPGQFRISSLYRSPQTNQTIGGAGGSQHLRGQAVDLQGAGNINRDIFNYIVTNLNFDQLIWEVSLAGGTAPNPFSAPTTGGNPQWVHVSYDPNKTTQRKQILFGDTISVPKKYTSITLDPNVKPDSTEPRYDGNAALPKTNTTTDSQGNQSDTELELSATFAPTFEQIERNVNNLELGDVDVTWGKRVNPDEDSDWISLKQFLLYLATRYVPQSVFPFVELIPRIKVDKAESVITQKENFTQGGYIRDGKIPREKEEQLLNSSNKEDQKLLDKLKFLTELPPGFSEERFNVGADALNKATGNADLFTIDPFQEGIAGLGQLSESGKKVQAERNIGVRAYGQLVFTPAPIAGVPSKPGAIGFTDLEIQAGSQSDNGLALIQFTLVDVQGNKFTDINSPWAFIFDVRPGSIGGDFYFRYGWQIRVPDPNDKNDLSSIRFWNHPGWKVFPEDIREELKKQILPGKQIITLTQCLNTGPALETVKNEDPLIERLAIFDEGVDFDPTSQQVKVTRSALFQNYTLCSILNPELSVDTSGVATATLAMRTAGAITALMPLNYAITTRKLIQLDKKFNLGDLILAIENDIANFGFLTVGTDEQKIRQKQFQQQIKDTYRRANSGDRQFPEVVIVGPEEGDIGKIHPDDIEIELPSKLAKQVLYPNKDEGITLIRWFRQVLQENESELSSAATGSGAGINAAWIISTTKAIDRTRQVLTEDNAASDSHAKLINYLTTEKDVFSYRFQGSLVESLTIEKTEATNAMKIQADNTVGDLLSDESEIKDTADFLKEISTPTSAADRKRNLLTIFSQMQNVKISGMCHPWMGPGKKFFVKGTGFYDGEYLCLQVSHKLSGHKFTTELEGARIPLFSKEDEKEGRFFSRANGKKNFGEKVTKQQKGSVGRLSEAEINKIIQEKTAPQNTNNETTNPQGAQ